MRIAEMRLQEQFKLPKTLVAMLMTRVNVEKKIFFLLDNDTKTFYRYANSMIKAELIVKNVTRKSDYIIYNCNSSFFEFRSQVLALDNTLKKLPFLI